MNDASPGWYPDSDEPEVLRWWDGEQWTGWCTTLEALERRRLAPAPYSPQVAGPGGLPPLVRPVVRPALGGGWRVLTIALYVLLSLIILVDLGQTGLAWKYVVTIRMWRADLTTVDADLGLLLDAVGRGLSLSWLALVGLTAVLFITWLYQAHLSDRMDPTRLSHSSGWAIGGWFVPVLNLWRPVQMVRDVFRGAGRPTVPTVVGVWWAAFLASSFAARISLITAPSENLDGMDYLDAAITSSQVEAVASALDLVAAVLAIVVVRTTATTVGGPRHTGQSQVSRF